MYENLLIAMLFLTKKFRMKRIQDFILKKFKTVKIIEFIYYGLNCIFA